MFNTINTDDLATQGVVTSVDIALTKLSRYIPVSVSDGLK